jgi:hypothetical protein
MQTDPRSPSWCWATGCRRATGCSPTASSLAGTEAAARCGSRSRTTLGPSRVQPSRRTACGWQACGHTSGWSSTGQNKPSSTRTGAFSDPAFSGRGAQLPPSFRQQAIARSSTRVGADGNNRFDGFDGYMQDVRIYGGVVGATQMLDIAQWGSGVYFQTPCSG